MCLQFTFFLREGHNKQTTDARIEIQVSCCGCRTESRGARRNLVVSLKTGGSTWRAGAAVRRVQGSSLNRPHVIIRRLAWELCSCPLSRTEHRGGLGPPPSSSSTLHLRQRLAIEALPPDTLRRLPPVPVVAAADGAVVHLHIDPGWDDRRSGEAIWTCRVGRGRGGRGDSKEGLRKARNEALPRASLIWRSGGLKQRAGGVRGAGADVQIFSRTRIGGLVFATLKRFC